MMMSPIGKLSVCLVRLPGQGQQGFSLVEVLLSVVILSAGLVAVNQTLLQSLAAADYVNTRAQADQASEKKIWEIKNSAWVDRVPPPLREEGMLLEGRNVFPYQVRSVSVRGSRFLHEVRLSARWVDSGRQKGLTRTFYARLPYEAK